MSVSIRDRVQTRRLTDSLHNNIQYVIYLLAVMPTTSEVFEALMHFKV